VVRLEELANVARDFVSAFDARDASALDRLNQHYRRAYTFEDLDAEVFRRVYAFRQRRSAGMDRRLLPAEAQLIVAQDKGYPSWSALADGLTRGIPGVPPHVIDAGDNCISPARQLSDREWTTFVALVAERRITAVASNGLITDAVLARIATLPHVTSLTLEGSRQISDDGLAHLGNMPQLEHVNLSGTKITDTGLQVLRELPNLRRFEMNWQRGVSDAGVSFLSACDHLERVDLMGSAVGDGAVRALQGKAKLREFKSGRLLTDDGLALLRGLPLMKSGDSSRLLIDGPFTDAGLRSLVALDGVAELDLFWHCTAITAEGFAHLTQLRNLHALGADGELSNDASMQHMAAMPRLSRLRAQEAVATDVGFEALSRSRTLQSFWGRECAGFGNRGFLAFSRMPSLQELGIGCRNVDDASLAAFADFPALRSLTPIGVQDSGFRHIGRCRHIERLTCMYCRTTTDQATQYIAGLPLKYYYAGLTLISDRSLQILGGMTTLEQVEFYEVNGITDVGVARLAALPHLREVAIDSCPGVTLAGMQVFPSHVRARYST
jgi:hypothetical protein